MDSLLRLQKYIADSGVTSRRKAEELITSGKVTVNGKKVTELGTKVDPNEDVIMINGEVIDRNRVDHIYLVLNKPRGYITTVSDPEGRDTVMDLVPQIKTRVFPVGRLDYLSEGLLLMTNDGDFSNLIMHPKFEVIKTYEVKVFGKVTDTLLQKLKGGITTDVGVLKPKSVRVIEVLPGKTWLEFRLNEGKNREIRRLCEAFGLTIDKLRRVAIGGLSLTGVKPGEWSYISKADLFKLIGINKDGTKAKIPVAYTSPKKSVDLLKKSRTYKREVKLADSKDFQVYRKDQYFKTLAEQKALREKIEEEKKQKEMEGVTLVARKRTPSRSKESTNYRKR